MFSRFFILISYKADEVHLAKKMVEDELHKANEVPSL